MSEREMRHLLASLCADLDRRARQLGRGVKKVVLPAALGAGLALGMGGCSDDSSTAPDAKVDKKDGGTTDAKVDIGPVTPYGIPSDIGVDTPGTLYMAPDFKAQDLTKKEDVGPVPPYMAPDGGGGGLLYMAPDAN